MAEKRNITKEDVLLKTRLLAEGVRYEVKGPSQWGAGSFDPLSAFPAIVLDGCDVVVLPFGQNPRSRLEAVIEGNSVTISDMGEVVGTGTLQVRAAWRDLPMQSWSGTTVNDAISYDGAFVAEVTFSNRCYAYDSGQTCKYCGFGHDFSLAGPLQSASEALASAETMIEPLAVAIENGWRGALLFVGGATPPDRRGQWTTDVFEGIMTRIHERIGADLLSEIQIASDVYPPDDLGDLYKWKSFGMNSCQFDSEVMDPTYFRAICPAKGEKQRWHEAQEAAAEVFGRGRGSSSLVVAGIEPMAQLLEGVEERLSKGVYMQPLQFQPYPNSPMEGMRPPSAEWYMEANEKIAELYFKYGDTFDIPLTEDDRWGYTRRGNSYATGSDDEKSRRLQEMGKLGPGLPKQDGIEMAGEIITPQQVRRDIMAFSTNTPLGELLADPRAKAVLEGLKVENGQPNPGWTDDSQLQQAMGFSLRQIASYAPGQMTEEALQEADEELGKL